MRALRILFTEILSVSRCEDLFILTARNNGQCRATRDPYVPPSGFAERFHYAKALRGTCLLLFSFHVAPRIFLDRTLLLIDTTASGSMSYKVAGAITVT